LSCAPARAHDGSRVSSLRNFALPGLALLGVIAYWLWRPSIEVPPPSKPAAASSRELLPDPEGQRRDGEPPPDAKSTGSASAAPPTAAAEALRRTRRDRAASDALRLALRERARRTPSGSGSAGATAEPPATEQVLDKDYIRSRIQDDLVPIAQECYESALEDDPKLAGKLIMKFTIVGDEEVGGVVDEAELDPSSDLKHPALGECMRESMLSLSFAPPPDGGTVSVTYPFAFAPGEE
jgi:hypothetical protein